MGIAAQDSSETAVTFGTTKEPTVPQEAPSVVRDTLLAHLVSVAMGCQVDDDIERAHFGRVRSTKCLALQFYWPGMTLEDGSAPVINVSW